MKRNPFITWTLLLGKHILKMPILPILLAGIPLLAIITSHIPAADTRSGVEVGIYFSKEDELSGTLYNKLLESGDAFSFLRYEDKEKMIEDVKLGALECAYVFDEEFWTAVTTGNYKKSVQSYVSPATIFNSAANELIFSCLIQISGYEIIGGYLHTESFPEEAAAEAEEYLYDAYEAYCRGGETFHLDIVTMNGISINQEGSDSLGITFPLRGMLSILIFLAGMLGSVAWLNDNEQGIFAPRSVSFKLLSRILYIALPALLFLLCSQLTLFLTGNSRSFLMEFGLSLRYLALIVVFCSLCSLLLKKSSRMTALIPVLTLGSLVFCPVFVNIESFLPMLKFVSRLFLPRYFL